MSTDTATVDETTEDETPRIEASEQETTEATGGATPTRRGRFATILLAVVVIAATGVAAVLGWQLRNERAVDRAASEASEVAREYAVTLTSVSADDLDADFAAVLDGATGEFKEMYAQSSEQLEQLLIDNQARAEGTVIEAGVKSATTTTVEVLLFIDQSVTNALVPEPRLDRSRVVMTMELVDGRWLASKVDLP